MAPVAGHSATPSSNASGGCSVGHAAPTSGAAFLSIFGLLGLVRRRRSRAA
jgi:MYXO-CTERM domain-containing protein